MSVMMILWVISAFSILPCFWVIKKHNETNVDEIGFISGIVLSLIPVLNFMILIIKSIILIGAWLDESETVDFLDNLYRGRTPRN